MKLSTSLEMMMAAVLKEAKEEVGTSYTRSLSESQPKRFISSLFLSSGFLALTFTISLFFTFLLSSLFPTQKPVTPVTKSFPIGSRIVYPTPQLSIGNFSGSPVQILVEKATLHPSEGGQRLVYFVVKNVSDSSITSCRFSYRLSNSKGVEASEFVTEEKGILKSGESEQIVLECGAEDMMFIFPKDVEFANGANWQFKENY